jgi:hypothetical protein
MILRSPTENENGEHVFDPNRSCPTIPSFPHAFSGNPGGIRTGPPIKTFGVTVMGTRISARQPQFSKEITKATKKLDFLVFSLRGLRAFVVNKKLNGSHRRKS